MQPLEPSRSENLGSLPTEQRNPATTNIDQVPTMEMVTILNQLDATIAEAVEPALPYIAEAIDRIADCIRKGGRLIYIGAGTSGRLGVLDASECPPTYNTPPELVIGLIAGGDHALRHSVENVEDRPDAGAAALREIDLTASDVVVGIAASGRTPFVVGALKFARETGATTISLSNVEHSVIASQADIELAAVTGPEPITGSTRMNAGTAQKMVLNMLSTGAMIRLGKTFGNLMVDVQASNEKLRDRAIRIVSEAVDVDRDEAERLLASADDNVKIAIVMGLLGIGATEATQRLEGAGGVVRTAVEQSPS